MYLYHGTASKDAIVESGFNTEWVFLTNRREIAEDYGFDVVVVNVDVDNLYVDLDISSSKGVTIDTANVMTGNDFETMSEYINNGYSVCVKACDIISVS